MLIEPFEAIRCGAPSGGRGGSSCQTVTSRQTVAIVPFCQLLSDDYRSTACCPTALFLDRMAANHQLLLSE
jgi:hypothetical protein